MNKAVRIGPRTVAPGRPCFIIAEAGVNHNGRLDLALRLVDAAAKAGADAVKFQTFSAERLAAACAPKARYQKAATGTAESQLDMLRRLELSEGAHRRIIAGCRRRKIMFLSTPFEEESADLLERLGVPAFKIPSGEITNLPFLRHIARKRRPMIVSTGMSDMREVAAAVAAIRSAGNPPLALLHCVSNYPASPSAANLRAMRTLERRFRVPVGYSDHCPGPEISLAAVALGACVIEKHFTLDRALPGPDHAASLEPGELAALIRGIRDVESSLGNGLKVPAPEERDTASAVRKSLVAAGPIAKGSVIARRHLGVMRPGTGLRPSKLEALIGRCAARDIPAGTLLSMEMFR